ncbi:MAG: MmcQ/YjbR family DNA-binding protein [Chloroflexota bacterium]
MKKSAATTIERVRKICLAMPEATEKPFGGHEAPCFRVRDKIFAHVYETGEAVTVKGGPGAQDVLVHSDPARFFVPPYSGKNGWLGIQLDAPGIDWAILEDLLRESYRLVAPKRLAALVTD